MSDPRPLLKALASPTAEPAAAMAELGAADALLLEWNDEPRGLYAWLAAAALAGRTLLPARWLPARPQGRGGVADGGRLLWAARSDAALRRLFSDQGMDPEQLSGSARPDEPLALLGMPGDVLTEPTADPFELRRRAELWLQKLGSDRVAIVLSGRGNHEPLRSLAQRRHLPLLHLADGHERLREADGGAQPRASALLQPNFQLDSEYRLPDEHYVPALRDLLHRGSLLRERSLFERLPENWRAFTDAEMRALYAWHVSPLLRRAGALLQSFLPVPKLRLVTPLPRCEGVVAYLLGLSDLRPDATTLQSDPQDAARRLVAALQAWDRQIAVELPPDAWPMLSARLAPWVEAGHLAGCADESTGADASPMPGRAFCFSGQPLWLRARLARSDDGLPMVPLDKEDRRALGWFELQLRFAVQPSAKPAASAQFMSFPMPRRDCEQLPLLLEGSSA